MVGSQIVCSWSTCALLKNESIARWPWYYQHTIDPIRTASLLQQRVQNKGAWLVKIMTLTEIIGIKGKTCRKLPTKIPFLFLRGVNLCIVAALHMLLSFTCTHCILTSASGTSFLAHPPDPQESGNNIYLLCRETLKHRERNDLSKTMLADSGNPELEPSSPKFQVRPAAPNENQENFKNANEPSWKFYKWNYCCRHEWRKCRLQQANSLPSPSPESQKSRWSGLINFPEP